MDAAKELREGQIVTGSLFSEPMRVEPVRARGDGAWTVGLVGTTTERFRKVTQTERDVDETPILEIVRGYQNRIFGRTVNQAAHAGDPAFLFLDGVQTLSDWAPQLETLVDPHTVPVVVAGGSVLRIEAGKDSLAGRLASLELGTLLLREISGLRRDFGERG